MGEASNPNGQIGWTASGVWGYFKDISRFYYEILLLGGSKIGELLF